ncbi:cytochrome b/b6 domain-containing protein [Granulosicoccus antarcticus]|uniref:Cytochrome b561 bacterial/Ni-hydrogenase domain-containing protein n=1 Tax=Granulosicoccus antarcticus IMCC3135 TaxID=1192854 RepID=A0A2Z2P7K6_9GAMM|nr:cytochrome b/b6 domain-containing protein [Granulosicoccus antarcticus]ASJ75824.1 hypothetical protein IMCC3135_28860 [Granulosicoccus antarcticus IMCC3135]
MSANNPSLTSSSTTSLETNIETHNRATRLLHAILAISIVTQLGSSLLMVAPLRNHTPDLFFEIHEYSGLAALALSIAFWITILIRRSGTPVAKILPWFSPLTRQLLWQDARQHFQTLRGKRLPSYQSDAPLACAIHGLGLLLILAMAITGGLFYLALLLGTPDAAWAGLDLDMHKLLASMAWTYLIAHAGVAVLYRYVGQLDLGCMWSFKGDTDSK